MSLHRQLHRVVVTGVNYRAFISKAERTQLILGKAIQDLNIDSEVPFIYFVGEPISLVDIRSTNTSTYGAPELHVLVQVYWHNGPVGPVADNEEWAVFKKKTLDYFKNTLASLFPLSEVECIFTMVPTVEYRPHVDHEQAKPANLTVAPYPLIIDLLYKTQTKGLPFATKPYGAITERTKPVQMPCNDTMWDLLFKYASARCMTTLEMMGTHIPRDHRMKNMLTDDQHELRRHAKGDTRRNPRCLPSRGVSLWLYTNEPNGNACQPEVQTLLDAMQLFAAGAILNRYSLNPAISQLTLDRFCQGNEPARIAMTTRFTYIDCERHLRMLQDFYHVRPMSPTSQCIYIVWPCNDIATGGVSFESYFVDLTKYVGTSCSVVDLQYDLQQHIHSLPLPPHVKKTMGRDVHDDLKRGHYERYILRTIDRFHQLHRKEDRIQVDRNANLVEVAHGVLHPTQCSTVTYEVMLEYASPMILLVAKEWASLVKEHLQCFQSTGAGLPITVDMITTILRCGFDTLSGDVGLYVAYYELQPMLDSTYWFANCGTTGPHESRRFHTTCVQVDADFLQRVTLEMRKDVSFLDGIYADPIQRKHVNQNWTSAIGSLRNIYTTPIAPHVPRPFELDLPEESSRIIDVIRSPGVDKHLQTLFKEASHLIDRSSTVETFLDVLTNTVRKSHHVDTRHVDATVEGVLQQALVRRQAYTSNPEKKRRRRDLTLDQLRRAWSQPLDPKEWKRVDAPNDDDQYEALRSSLDDKHGAFWVVEKQPYSVTYQTYYCADGEWTPCPPDDVLLAPIKDPEAKLVVYTTRHCHENEETRLYVQFFQ